MNRVQAYQLMTQMIQNKNLQKHGLAVEAIMRELCQYLKNRETKYVIANPEGVKQSQGLNSEIATSPSAPRNDNGDEFNEEEWAIVGLLHDADYELIEKDPSRHTLVTEEKLRELGYDNQRVINGIKAHHDGIKPTRDNLLEKAVYCADELSGLITACALVKDKKLENVTVDTVMKKFSEKSFAAGAKREQIAACEEELGIPLEEFIAIALRSMQKISGELGL